MVGPTIATITSESQLWNKLQDAVFYPWSAQTGAKNLLSRCFFGRWEVTFVWLIGSRLDDLHSRLEAKSRDILLQLFIRYLLSINDTFMKSFFPAIIASCGLLPVFELIFQEVYNFSILDQVLYQPKNWLVWSLLKIKNITKKITSFGLQSPYNTSSKKEV